MTSAKIDRLASLIGNIRLRVAVPGEAPNLYLVERGPDGPADLILTSGAAWPPDEGPASLAATVSVEGAVSTLLTGQKPVTRVPIQPGTDMAGLVVLIRREAEQGRCGASAMLDRLCEALFICLLRHMLDTRETTVGVLGGLADRHISRALVAMHEQPGKAWTNEALAELSALSLGHFIKRFTRCVGETPQRHLRGWRLALARNEVEGGIRVEVVARKYGFRSPDGFSRAFVARFGRAPLSFRAKGFRDDAASTKNRADIVD